jgi:hypothetical protein
LPHCVAREPNVLLTGARPEFLEDWSEEHVRAWLEGLKTRFKKLNDDAVDAVACDGEALAERTEAQMKDIAGVAVGIDIFNAVQKLPRASAGACFAFAFPRTLGARWGCACVFGCLTLRLRLGW